MTDQASTLTACPACDHLPQVFCEVCQERHCNNCIHATHSLPLSLRLARMLWRLVDIPLYWLTATVFHLRQWARDPEAYDGHIQTMRERTHPYERRHPQ